MNDIKYVDISESEMKLFVKEERKAADIVCGRAPLSKYESIVDKNVLV